MDWLLKSITGKNLDKLPEEVSFIFAIVVILGFFWIFFKFISGLIKYYFETLRPMLKTEKDLKSKSDNREGELKAKILKMEEDALIAKTKKETYNDDKVDRRKEGKETFDMILDVYEKMDKISREYAGKYANKEEVKELRDRINEVKEDLANLRGQLSTR